MFPAHINSFRQLAKLCFLSALTLVYAIGGSAATLRVEQGSARTVSLAELLPLDPVVILQTVAGDIPLQLTPTAAPQTVANFLQYVEDGSYIDSFIHRSAILQNGDPFVIQGGGFYFEFTDEQVFIEPVATHDPVVNEPNVTNSRGTVAMAKLDGDPDSATSQWFVNLSDNGPILDDQNGGFTVFGRVTGDGMQVADAVSALPVYDLRENLGSGAFGEVPLVNVDESVGLLVDNFVIVLNAFVSASEYSASLADGQPQDVQISVDGDQLHIQVADAASGSRTVLLFGGSPGGDPAALELTIEIALGFEAFRNRYFANDRMRGSGWHTSSVLGDYYAADFPWLWQQGLGWTYVIEDSAGSFWMWDALSQQWFWVLAADYPIAYSFGFDRWVYLDRSGQALANQRWIYLYDTGWQQF